MMSPHIDLLIAHARHLDLVREASSFRAARDASRARRTAPSGGDPVVLSGERSGQKGVVVSGGLEPSTSRM